MAKIQKAEGVISLKLLPDELRKRFVGSLNYQAPDANDQWIYKKMVVDHDVSSPNIFATSDEYMGVTSSDALVLAKPVKYIVITHTGYSNTSESIITNAGVLITFTGANPDWNSDDDDATPIFLAPGDTIALKVPISQADDWRARTCRITDNIPSANGSSGDNALIEIIALIDKE